MKSIKYYRTELPYAFEYSLFDEKKHPKTYGGEEYLAIVKNFDDSGNLIEYKKFRGENSLSYELFISYDDASRKTEEKKVYHETGTSENTVYTYEGDTIRAQFYNDDIFVKRIETKKPGEATIEETQYDIDSNVTEISKWDKDSKLLYHFDGEETTNEYDEKGNIMKIKRVTGTSVFEEAYKYEAERPKKISYLENGESIGYVEFDYEQDGDTLLTREHEGDDIISETFETKNEQGNVTKHVRKEYDEDGNATESTQQFDFDDAGRIKRINIIADPKRAQYIRHAPAMLARSKEIAYNDKGNPNELLLANYQDEECEAESYYRIEYESSAG